MKQKKIKLGETEEERLEKRIRGFLGCFYIVLIFGITWVIITLF